MADTDRLADLERKFAENPRRYFAPLANELRKAGDLAAAVQLCRDQLARYPGHMSGYVVLGQALYESRRPDDAREAFTKALELDAENLIALRHLGDIARDAGDAGGARGWYQRVLEADPRNDDIAAQLERLAPAARMAPPAPVVQSVAFTPAPPPPPPVEPLEWSALDLDLPGGAAVPAPVPDEREAVAPVADEALAPAQGLLDVDLVELGLAPASPVEPAEQVVPEAEHASAGDADAEREAEAIVAGAQVADSPAQEQGPAAVAWEDFLPELPGEEREDEGAAIAPRVSDAAASLPEAEVVAAAAADGAWAPDAAPPSYALPLPDVGLDEPGTPDPAAEPVLESAPEPTLEPTLEPVLDAWQPAEAPAVTPPEQDELPAEFDLVEVEAELLRLDPPPEQAAEAPAHVEVQADAAASAAADAAFVVDFAAEELALVAVPSDVPLAGDAPAAEWTQPTEATEAPDAQGVASAEPRLAQEEEPGYDPVVGLDLPPVESALSEPAGAGAEAPAAGEQPAPELEPTPEPAGSVPSATFVTETMAELLLRQGHRDQALGVYDRLLAQRPDDADLRGRVAALREQPAPASTAGAFFAALAATPAEPTDAADAAIVDAREPEPEGEVPDGGPLAGAVSTADALAADRLASGFDAVDDGPSTLLAALDARAAASPPPAPPPGAVETPYAMAEFSFERFFEGLEEPSDASDEPPEPAVADAWAFGDVPRGEVRTPTPASGATAVHPAPPPPEPAEDDDLAQFNAWLKGLIQP